MGICTQTPNLCRSRPRTTRTRIPATWAYGKSTPPYYQQMQHSSQCDLLVANYFRTFYMFTPHFLFALEFLTSTEAIYSWLAFFNSAPMTSHACVSAPWGILICVFFFLDYGWLILILSRVFLHRGTPYSNR